MIAWMLHTAVGCGRQMYDTRLYTEVYNAIVTDTVLRQRQAGIEPTAVAARSTMSREFVTFFEKDMPVVINAWSASSARPPSCSTTTSSSAPWSPCCFIPVAVINRNYMRLSLALNASLNNQLEQEVKVIDGAQPQAVMGHFAEVRGWRIKLSDADARNWTMIEVLSMVVFVLVLLRVAYLPNPEAGTIFAMFFYVWRLMEKLDLSPQIVQQLMRLQDIRRRIEAGMPIEAIG